MDRNMQLYLQAAEKLHMPGVYHGDTGYLEICLGKKNYYFRRTATPMNYGAGAFVAAHKFMCNQLFSAAGVPVAKAVSFDKEQWLNTPLKTLITTLSFPLVVKPLKNTSRGEGVYCKIPTIAELSLYLDDFFKKFEFAQVEEFLSNLKEYRVLILKNKVIGVIERTGASVIGDGAHTIEQLIEIKNVPRNKLSATLTTSPLVYDQEYENCLQEQGYNLHSIPPEGQKVRLGYTANTGRGGDMFSMGKKIHPENAKLLINAVHTIGLEYAGLDMLCTDINVPFKDAKWFIIEANVCPDLTLHELAPVGEKASVVKPIFWQLIKRHPFSYLYNLCMRSKLSIYFKCTALFGVFLTFFHYI